MLVVIWLVTALGALANATQGTAAGKTDSNSLDLPQHEGFLPVDRTTWGFNKDWFPQVDLSGLEDLFVCDRDTPRSSHENPAGHLGVIFDNVATSLEEFLWGPPEPRPTLWEELHAYIRGTPVIQDGGFWRELWYGKARAKESLWEIVSDHLWGTPEPTTRWLRWNNLTCSLHDGLNTTQELGARSYDLVKVMLHTLRRNVDDVVEQGPGPVLGGVLCVVMVLGVAWSLEPAAEIIASLLSFVLPASGPPAIGHDDIKPFALQQLRLHVARGHMPCMPSIVEGDRVSYVQRDGQAVLLGRGRSGVVYLGHIDGETQVAIKVYMDGPTTAASVLVEAAKACHMNSSGASPHAYGVVGLCPSRDYCCLALVCQYVGRPERPWTLYDQLTDPAATPLSVKQCRHLALHLFQGVATMHRLGVIHNDLKFDNILVDVPEGRPMVPYIADFGISVYGIRQVRASQPDDLEDHLARHPHLAPEMLLEGHVSAASDVYALGWMLTHLARHCRDTRMALMASWCRHRQPEKRATVAHLVRELQLMLRR